MKYKIVIEKTVEKFLKSHPEIVEKFLYCLDAISTDPLSSFCDTKKIQGLSDTYRLRIGKYRFLYKVDNGKIIIYFFDAGSRGDIYK